MANTASLSERSTRACIGWDYWTFTPLERPEGLADRATLSVEEAAALAQELNAEALARDLAAPPGETGAYSQAVWTDRARATALTQTSLIIDPPDGRIPPLTSEAEAREAARLAADGQPVRIRVGGYGTAGPEERGLAERCLLGFSTGPPLLPGGYNNNVQIFQTPGQLSLTRLALGSAGGLHLVERLTRVDDDSLLYEFTVNDPASFTRPFTGRLPMNGSDLPLYEYACHEGNYGMENLLRGARAEEGAAAVSRR